MRIVMSLLCLLLSLSTQAADDPKLGKSLHEKHCAACHAGLEGGDGSAMYTRKPRLINNLVALGQRVTTCSALTKSGLFPEDDANIAAWLNEAYYKFK